MPEPLLSAAMIVRDEEAHLEGCLRSIRALVDEIVIVDTGSTDGTVSLARSLGARVHIEPWRGSFAEPRNLALEMARGTWILYIDADERLRPISPDLVRSTLQRASEVALRVRLTPFAGATPYWEYRLWRADPRIRFDGVIHEKVAPSINALAAADGLTVGESDLFLDHLGYEGDQTHKHRRNLPLLRAQLSADPADAYNWGHLATVLEGLGDETESDAALERAVQLARDNGATPGGLAFAALVRRRREQGRDSAALLEEALSRYPDTLVLAWLKVCAEIEAGRYEDALRWLKRFEVDTTMPIEDTIAYPAALFGAQAPDARGLCLFKLGRYREAAAAYRQAEEFEPGDQAHRVKRLLAEHKAVRDPNGSSAMAAPVGDAGLGWGARELVSGVTIDLGGVPVGLRATDATRAQAVHTVFGRIARSAQDPVVRIGFGAHRVPLPARRPDEWQAELRLWHDERALALAYATSISASAESGRGTVGGYAPDLGRAFRQVVPFLLASLLAPHELFVLHAGAIQRDGDATLVLGGSGLGKSTLILGALEDGWSVLADDLILVRADASGAAVIGIPRTLSVPREVVVGDVAAWTVGNDARERVQLPFEEWDRSWRPIRSIVVVAHGAGEETVLEAIEPVELLAIVMHSMLSRQPHNVRRYAKLAITLCGLPARRLLHSATPGGRARSAADAISAIRQRGWLT